MKVKEKQNLSLKPVHPRSVKHHGFLGKVFVKQHMMMDERWSIQSLMEQFMKMGMLIEKHALFHRIESRVQQKQMIKVYKSLQKQCKNGHSMVQFLRTGRAQEVRNILKYDRHMQRLYQKMPLYMAEENINQKTFVKRKERDRLQDRLKQLENIYKAKLIEKGDIEDRISYENEFKLAEDKKIIDLMKKLENLKLRLQANMAINATYKKIIEILKQDGIFYLPILRSLEADVEDQTQFIKHILQLGSPAIKRFQELSDQYKLLDDVTRKTRRQNIADCSRHQKKLVKFKPQHMLPGESQHATPINAARYMRETKSMLALKNELKNIEEIMNRVEIATLSSNEKSIYPRRLEKINKLKEAIKAEDKLQENLLEFIKSRANIFVLLRLILWNLHDILKHVGPRKVPNVEYPVDYLKLPLLTYEMLNMKAYPPDAFEQNIVKLLQEIQSKLKLLTKAFDWKLNDKSISILKNSFCDQMHQDIEVEKLSISVQGSRYRFDTDSEGDVISYKTVPNRNEIKLASIRIVDERLKRDE